MANSEPSTVFVVGAGASSEANLPIGSALTDHIAKCLNFRFERSELKSGDGHALDAIRVALKEPDFAGKSLNDFVNASRRIALAMPQAISIDNFLDVHNEDRVVEICGKIAIVREILRAESSSIMRPVDTNAGNYTLSFQGVRKTYYSYLFQLLTENCRFTDLPARLRRVCFVVFNYDRCIELYLRYAVQNYYAVSDAQAVEALKALRIFHPYGTVGQLPIASYGAPISLGGEPNGHDLLATARNIKTFTESTDPGSSNISDIRAAVQVSQRIVFLGFAYHRMNIELLSPTSKRASARGDRRIFGTAVGVSKSDLELISIDLAERFSISRESQYFTDKPCSEMFGEYWRSLSFV